MTRSYWLLKTEPNTYSFQDLLRDGRTPWNGVRNFQARNYLRSFRLGDLTLIYHSGDEKAVVGIAQVVKEAYTDLDPKKKGDWVQVDVEAVRILNSPIPLADIKNTPLLRDIPLIRQSRLSVMPITFKHFETLIKLGAKSQ